MHPRRDQNPHGYRETDIHKNLQKLIWYFEKIGESQQVI